jgi:hypothetical protein
MGWKVRQETWHVKNVVPRKLTAQFSIAWNQRVCNPDTGETLVVAGGVVMERLDDLIAGARASGFTIDFLDDLTYGLSRQAARRVIGNASMLPSYRKSNDNPYVFRSARAPSSESR